jgi:prevent-host-death family protein
MYDSHMRSIRASEFKAKCLAILDEVSRTGESITILKRGRPVGRLLPPLTSDAKHPQLTLKGTFEILGNIVEPATPAEDWEAEGGGAP